MDRILFEHPNLKALRKEHTVVDMHSHTQASHDCSTKLDFFAQRIKQLGLGIAVTDHNEIKGSIYIHRKYPKQFIIPGIEVTSVEDKHVLLYFPSYRDMEAFYKKHIEPTKKKHRTQAFRIRTLLPYPYILDVAKDYGAFRVLPHPLIRGTGLFRSLLKKKDFSILKSVEAIEVMNSTQTTKMNIRSVTWAHLENKPYTGGSDSHVLKTLGNSVTIARAETVEDFLEDIRKRRNHVIGHSNTWRTEMSNLSMIMRNKLKLARFKKKLKID